ncbi:MAG: ArsB/NhaD family transporter [Intestinibacter sp.]|uniref:ArsB/NhaD family transporter n=2 Tax=Intestinibacter sp. TaxID=1965304 RepID=UPI002A7F5624|nr:ArsB/NhaD family transporter [Intestinibacter sp.]MDY4575751.1 ArsB/NhaD family transporter [Intestinibacter sp.]
MNTQQIIAIAIFAIVMLLIISEKIDRTVVALSGAALMFVFKILTFEEGISHIDFNTLFVLIGMMIVVSIVKKSGLFEYVAILTAKISKGDPSKIMVYFMIITAFLSAVLDNVTTVLLIGPMTLVISDILSINPIPFLITQILASNIGGTSTLIGDPPNIMIGSAAGLSFGDFIVNLGPIIVIILAIVIVIFKIFYRKQLVKSEESEKLIANLDEKKAIQDKTLLVKSILVLIMILIGFMSHSKLGIESSVVALSGACILLLIGKQDPHEIIYSVEWPTIAFFAGLFIIVGGLSNTGVISMLANLLITETHGNVVLTMFLILWISAIVSSFLDNIPFVATLIPLILTMQTQGMDVMPLWWATSLGACLGGNGTLIGASANVVLASVGQKHGYPITFIDYLKIGFPIMILTIIISSAYLLIKFAI